MADKPFYMKLQKDKVNKDIANVIPFFNELSQKKKNFLINLYVKSYEYGTRLLKNDVFYNKSTVLSQDLKNRFYKYPDIENKNLAFIKKVAEKDETSLNAIIEENANQDDFVYEVYENNFIDKSMDILHTIVVPEDFEDIDIYLVSQDAFADGVMKKIDFLAKNSMIDWATKMIGDM